tara:strand:- start:291 stop:494 length:204 start_codon:yes stop_codon:yes gene_type:complete
MSYKKESIADLSIKIDLRTDWERLFGILQALNPESDKFEIKEDISDSEDRWEDVCYYMDSLKPEEEE